MTDTETQEQSVADPEGTNEGEATQTAEKPPKVVKQPHACYCSTFEVGNYEDGNEEDVFTTGCNQTTKGTFAQGHDARLVSFLVDGYLDGYKLRQVVGNKATMFATPAEAARTASDALAEKAAKATANGEAKAKAAQERKDAKEKLKAEKAEAKAKAAEEKAKAKEAAKAAGPKATGAEVVAGSTEGDPADAPEGTTKIKVGRWEYDATIDPETEVATYVDGKGERVEVERDGYRVLTPA